MTRPTTPRDHLIRAWASLVTRRPWLVVLVAVVVAGVSIAYTALNLEYRADRSALVDPTVDWQVRYAEYKENFPRWDDLIVAVDVSEADEDTARAFLRALEGALDRETFVNVTIGFDPETARADALFSRDMETVRETIERLRASSPVIGATTVDALVGLSELVGTNLPEGRREELAGLLSRANAIAEGDDRPLLDASSGDRLRLLTTETGRHAFALITLVEGADLRAGLTALRARIDQLLEQGRFASLEAGVTGVPALESDETAQSTEDATVASILSLSLIAVLMMIVYRRVEVPLFAVGALLLGVAASFGWVTLAVGHLQVLSVVFAIVLLGLGIDTAIHFIARLELLHVDHDHMGAALVRTFEAVGPGVVTGALTTAAAFGATSFTDFTGVAEMGVIASGGVLICTLFIMALFPALMVLVPEPEKRIRDREGGDGKPFVGRLGVWVDHHAPIVLVASVVVVALSGWRATEVRYDPDLIKLMPPGAESVRWERRVTADDAQSVWNAVVVADGVEEARRLIENLRALPEVSGVGGAADILDGGPDLQQKLELARTLPSAEDAPPSRVEDVAEAFRGSLERMASRWAGVDERIAGAASTLASMDNAALRRVAEAYARERDALLERVRALRTSEGPTVDSMPSAVRELFVSDLGQGRKIALRVYPSEPPEGQTVLSPEHLTPFADAVLRLAPDATGPTIQIYESSKLIKRAYANASLYALLAITLILLIDFRNPIDALCALIPVLCGASMLLAIMELLGEPLNFANTIVMPLIVGLGVDSGVHAVHRWRQQPGGRPAGLAGGTGRAIGITTLTTIVGFACMMTAEHRGIRSLGLVMSIGLATTWLASVTLLPAVLRVRGKIAK